MDITNSSEYEISLWGPSSSGKTTLMNSMMRALYQRTQKDPVFEYLLLDADEDNLQDYSKLFSSPMDEGTKAPRTTRWVFQRRLKSNKSLPKVVNVHSHLIQIHDMNGINTVNLDDSITRSIFENSRFLLLMLDHTLLHEGDAGGVTPWGTPSASKMQYLEQVERLIRFLEKSQPNQSRSLAVCFTKVDLMSLYREPWDLISASFGADMVKFLQGCQSKQGWKVESFAVSAVGFLHQNGQRSPNFDRATGALLNVENWLPYNVESPFFWMFNDIEKSRLKQHDSFLTQFFFNQDRTKDWVEYQYQRA